MADDPLLDDEESSGNWFMELLRTWGLPILAVLLIRTYVFEPFRIPSGSMAPSLEIGDHVVVDKSSYGIWAPASVIEVPFQELVWVAPRFEVLDLGDPERGDIIVFRYPEDEKLNYIKRVVGIPGDEIRVRDNQIELNGELQSREYIDKFPFENDRCSTMNTKRYVEDLAGLRHHMLANPMPGPLANFPLGSKPIVVPEGHVFVMGDNRDNSEDSRRWEFVRYDQIKGKAHFVWFSWNSCAGGIRAERFFSSLYPEL